MKKTGVVAAGHKETAKAAEVILHSGGNAFDAVVAAHLAACVVEPVLTSLAGGGFLLAHTAEGKSALYDFFVQTPNKKRTVQETDFYPITADFGTVTQEFHIGLGSIATPGTVKGLFAIHKELCTMPMMRLAEPAINLAREGVVMNAFQAYIFDVVQAIYLSNPETLAIFGSHKENKPLLQQGEILKQQELADCLDSLAREGEVLFYQGEIAEAVSRLCNERGGHLSKDDFSSYQIIKRNPLSISYRQTSILTNPPPSSGGTLIAFALKLLEKIDLRKYSFGTANYLHLLAQILDMTDKARIDTYLNDTSHHPGEQLLDPEYIAGYRQQIMEKASCSRGTTHISVMDKQGNIASLTTSNGEGCGLFIPGTGIMLNNMLGEQDLNPHGFHRWQTNQRMSSMMAPSIVLLEDGNQIVLGSGGSNRLRTAILQVLINLIDFKMTLNEAISSPRIHCEANHLSVEGGFESEQLTKLVDEYPDHKIWEQKNLFFGGTHSVCSSPEGVSGVGDLRRGGVAMVVPS